MSNYDETQKQLKERFLFAVKFTISAVTNMLEDKVLYPDLAETQKELIFDAVLNGWLSALPMSLAEEVKTEVLGKMITEALKGKKKKSPAMELVKKATTESEVAMIFHQIGWDVSLPPDDPLDESPLDFSH